MKDCSRSLRITFTDDLKDDMCVATSIQIVMPANMAIQQARDFIIWQATRELESYAAQECATAMFT